jgi:hypothetical protein
MCYDILYAIAKNYYISIILEKVLKNKYIEDITIVYDKYTLIILKNIPGCLVFQPCHYKKDPKKPVGFIVALRSKGEKKVLGEYFFKDLNYNFNIIKELQHLKLVIDNDNNP